MQKNGLRSWLPPFLTLMLLSAALLVLAWVVDYLIIHRFWITLTAIVPALLVLQHGLYLYLFKPKITRDVNAAVEPQAQGRREQPSAKDSAFMHDYVRRTSFREQAQAQTDRAYSFTAISLGYFLPTLLTALGGLVPAYLLANPEALQVLNIQDPAGVILGALGAYVYVIMMLGERTFQRDISTGSAAWSAVQLFLGPVLGGVVAEVLLPNSQLTYFTKQVIYFFAGLAPRPIVSFITRTVQRFFADGQAVPTLKIIPLQTIRGITQRVEDRLYEEGITDGYMLAMANPIRLNKDTPFDLRQIVAWIDECLLYALVPDIAAALQKDGISGAIDLAYYWEMGNNGTPDKNKIKALAKRINVNEEMLEDIVRRFNEDAQVQLIWSMYQSLGDN